MKKKIAIILARGGSKGIPKKNVLDFCGHPLVAWSIIQAKLSSKIDEVYLSSDSEEILKIGKEYGAKIIKRPSNISGDSAKSEEAIYHALNYLDEKIGLVIMLEPTAPLRCPKDLDESIKYFFENNLDSCFSGAALSDFLIWKKDHKNKLTSVNYDYKKQGPRQEREPDYVENGAIYMFTPDIFLKEKNRFGGNIGLFMNKFWQSFEIDEKDDWDFVELIFKKYLLDKYKNLKQKVYKI